MAKDFDRIVKSVDVPDNYDIDADIMVNLYKSVKQGDVFEILYSVYKYGFAQGIRFQENKK